MPDAPSRPQFAELLQEGLEPFEVPHLWLAAEEPDTYVDITKTMDLKLEALFAHRSQGIEDAEEWVRERARELGKQGGTEYAEAFRAFAFMEDR